MSRLNYRPGAVIIGSGVMGRDVAAIFLTHGWWTTLIARDPTKWPDHRKAVRQSGKEIGATFDDQQLEFATAPGEVRWDNCRLVFEAIPERMDLKRALFQELDEMVPEQIPIATNTSGLRITEIADQCRTRARMAGMHFFLPAHIVPVVEVVRGEATNSETIEEIYEMMTTLDRVPVRVAKDIPGFLANRIQHALMREAFALVNDGIATPADIDKAVRFGFGFRYVAAGPMLQKELSGFDTQLSAAKAIYPSLNRSTTPSGVLTELVERGHLGIKSGHGFHPWSETDADRANAQYRTRLLEGLKILKADDETKMPHDI